MGEDNGWSTIATMLGTSAGVLRQAAQPWVDSPHTEPMSLEEFAERIKVLNAIEAQLNNTNLVEDQIRLALEPTDIPISLLKVQPLRLVD